MYFYRSTAAQKQTARARKAEKALFSKRTDHVRAALAVEGINLHVEKRTGKGKAITPLMYAISEKHYGVADLLLAAGADPVRGGTGYVPPYVTLASHDGDDAVYLMECMVAGIVERREKGDDGTASLDLPGNNGWRALHRAAYWGRARHVQILLEGGADATLANNDLNLPIDLARSEREHNIVRLLDNHMKQSKDAAPEDAAERPEESDGWVLLGAHEVSRVCEKTQIGYRLTEIFNFADQSYTRIAANTVSNAESQSLRFFNEIDNVALIAEAQGQLAKLGGRVPEAANSLGKPLCLSTRR